MLRQVCLLCAILSFTACATPPPKAPPQPVHQPGEIIGGLKLKPSGEVERQLTPSEVEDLRRRDNAKGR